MIEPTSTWILVKLVSAIPQWELPKGANLKTFPARLGIKELCAIESLCCKKKIEETLYIKDTLKKQKKKLLGVFDVAHWIKDQV